MRRALANGRSRRQTLARATLVAILAVIVAHPGGSPSFASHGGTHVGYTTYTSNTTWTLAGSPYVLDGSVTVAAGATLTIEPGVIVKLNGIGRELIVNGTLAAVGTAASRITFTSLQDDSIGGDSGGDGPTSGAPGQWYELLIGGSGSQLKYVDVRYGGYGSAETTYASVKVTGPLAIDQSTISDSQQSGVQVSSSGAVTIANSTIERARTGVYVNGGAATITTSTIRNNTKNGVYYSVPVAGSVNDSTVTANTQAGIVIYTASGGYVPNGARNNIYGNSGGAGIQLDYSSLQAAPASYWKNNFWGRDVYFRSNPSACVSPGWPGYLAYRGSTASPPDSPLQRRGDLAGSSVCYYSTHFRIGALEFSPFPFGELGAQTGTTLGSGLHAVNPSDFQEDPVNSATGSLMHQTTDLELPGVGLPFAFTRSYNSLDPRSGAFGRGWTHSYAASLEIAANGDVTLVAEDGQRVAYVKQPDGSFLGPAGTRSVLSEFLGAYTLVRSDQVKYHFDSAGRLTSMNDRNDQGLGFAYTNGRLSTITDSAGRTITLAYNPTSGLLTSVSVPDGRSVTYGYTNGQLTSVTDAAGKVWTYTYESHGFLEKELDPRGNTVFRNVYGDDGRVKEQYDGLNNKTSFVWDYVTQTQTATDARANTWKDVYTNNMLLKKIDALGKTTVFAHDSGLNESAVTGPDAQTTTMAYDARGNLTSAVAPASLNAQKTLTYDAQNNLTSVIDARGKLTTYGYDAAGNNTSVVSDGTTVATYAYNGSGQLTSSTDGRNNTTSYGYDASGNLVSETDPLGNTTTYTYDAAGRMSSRVDPRGNVAGANPDDYRWTYTYDGAGRMLTESDPLGNTTTYTYDGAGNRTSVKDANNKTATYAYDATNRLTSVTAPDGGVTTYSYDLVGNKLTETDPRNKTTTYTYDADNRLASVTTPLGNKTTYGYDDSGSLVRQVEPRGNVQGANPDDYATTYAYDAAGRLLSESDPLAHVTTYAYDAVGNRTSVTDANSHSTSYTYDGLNRLESVTAPGGAITSYTYDAAGNVLSRTDANNHTTSYAYDAGNRLTAETRPLSRQWAYAYDAAGNRTRVVDANGNATQEAGDGTTSYGYDRAGRLSTIDYSDSAPDVGFSYDGAGNRTQMTDGAGTQTYAYDGVNRLTGVTRGTDSFSYAYDLAGNLTRRTYPDGTVTDYSYDNDERMATTVSGGQTTSYAYDAAANLTQTALPAGNGYVEERTYDRASRLTRVKNVKGSDVLSDFSSTLDPVGNPTQVVRAGTLAGTTTYAYDVRDRLTEVCFQASCPDGPDPFIRWTYDPVGNRLSEARPSDTTSYSYNAADELTQAGSTSFSYDQNGNETQAGSRTFSYDLANRLASTTTSGQTTSYSYDGDGNRITATSGASQTRYVWDTSHSLPQLALERDGQGALLRRYLYGQRRLSLASGGNTSYYQYDPLGSVVNVTSSSGTTQWSYDYEPFGTSRQEVQDDPAAPANTMRFVGEQLDGSGLYYLRARQYDSGLGRFLQVDPVTQGESHPVLSSYAYAADRPTVMVDPSGMTFVPNTTGEFAARYATSPISAASSKPCEPKSLRVSRQLAQRSSGSWANFVTCMSYWVGSSCFKVLVRCRPLLALPFVGTPAFVACVAPRCGRGTYHAFKRCKRFLP